MRLKHPTDPEALLVSGELNLHIFMESYDIKLERQVHIPFAACGLYSDTKYARVDWVINKHWGQVILELDEHQHRSYLSTCDPRRDIEIMSSVLLGSGGKLVIIRINMDDFKIGGVPQAISKQDRYNKLHEVIQQLDNEPDQQNRRLFMYYDRSTP